MKRQAKQIFLSMIRDVPENQREAYLEDVGGDDHQLRTRVRALLRAHEQKDSFLQEPAAVLVGAVAGLDPTSPSAGPPSMGGGMQSGVLGDYRIVREVGRGGMGVVYEAEQISLRRRVALKVLPFASVLDKTQAVRFKNEACAAASLDHPHVVHVHAVGIERGVHYYAMQFIDGCTVADLIGDRRQHRSLMGEGAEASPRGTSGRVPTQSCEGNIADSASSSAAMEDTARVAQLAASTWRTIGEKERIETVVELAIQPPRLWSMRTRWGWSTAMSNRRISWSTRTAPVRGRFWLGHGGNRGKPVHGRQHVGNTAVHEPRAVAR